jgi:cytosine/adenosine deaminase-related metal-dependent hydrolase
MNTTADNDTPLAPVAAPVALVSARWILSGVADRHTPVLHSGAALAHQGGRVLAVGPADELRARYPGAAETRYPHHMVLPGFVNSHHHVGMTPLQLGSPDYALELWFASRLSARDIDPYLDTLYSAFEMLASGVTTVQHIHGWMPGPYSRVHATASAVLQAYRDLGMRASYCFAVREQNRFVYEADEDFCARLPPEMGAAMAAHLKAQVMPMSEFMLLFDQLSAENHSPLTRMQLAPANLHWVSDDGLLAMKAKADAAGVPMHMHLLETALQKEYARRRTGTTAVAHLHKLGLLGPRLTLGHGVWLTEADIELAQHTGTCICHNCSSNFRLRSGLLPLMAYEKRGITVGMGLDEAGINDDRDMLQEMRLALNVHRVPGLDDDDVPSCPHVLRMATEHGGMTTAFGDSIGRLEPGRWFDAAVIDFDAAMYPYQDDDIPPLDALIQRAKTQHMAAVWVGGQLVCENGRFTQIDRDATLAKLAEALAQPRTPAEQHRRWLRQQVFPAVKDFYRHYLDDEPPRQPFYGNSSRR